MRTADNRLYIEEAGPDIMDVLTAMGIAGMGGLVGWLRRKRYKNWRTFLAAIITAAFTGLLSSLITDWLQLDAHLQFAISGAAGYSGGMLLDTISPMLVHMVHHKASNISNAVNTEKPEKHAGREVKNKVKVNDESEEIESDEEPDA